MSHSDIKIVSVFINEPKLFDNISFEEDCTSTIPTSSPKFRRSKQKISKIGKISPSLTLFFTLVELFCHLTLLIALYETFLSNYLSQRGLLRISLILVHAC